MYEGAIQDLIDELGRLPGVGPKSAQRIAFHVLSADPADVNRLAVALRKVKEQVRFCTTCFNVAEAEQCKVCRDLRRTNEVLCVVEEPKDVVAIERTTASVGGGPPTPYSLRSTTIFRREGDEWKIVHRHGDPHDDAAGPLLARLVDPDAVSR